MEMQKQHELHEQDEQDEQGEQDEKHKKHKNDQKKVETQRKNALLPTRCCTLNPLQLPNNLPKQPSYCPKP